MHVATARDVEVPALPVYKATSIQRLHPHTADTMSTNTTAVHVREGQRSRHMSALWCEATHRTWQELTIDRVLRFSGEAF